MSKSPVDRAPDGSDLLPEFDGCNSTLRDSLGSEFEFSVHVLVRSGSTEAVETELLVRVLLPSLFHLLVDIPSGCTKNSYKSGHHFNRQDRDSIGKDGKLVFLRLGIEDFPTRKGDNTGDNIVFLLQVLDSVDTDTNLRTSRDQSNLGTLGLDSDVSSLDGTLNGGVFKLRKVLPGQSDNGGGVLRDQGNVISGRGLVAISWAPDHAVR